MLTARLGAKMDSLLLSCTTLSFATTCRFIPAHPVKRRSRHRVGDTPPVRSRGRKSSPRTRRCVCGSPPFWETGPHWCRQAADSKAPTAKLVSSLFRPPVRGCHGVARAAQVGLRKGCVCNGSTLAGNVLNYQLCAHLPALPPVCCSW